MEAESKPLLSRETVSQLQTATVDCPITIELPIDDLNVLGNTQSREKIDTFVVDDYAERMKAGDVFPPGSAMYDGSQFHYYDGFHRRMAAVKAGFTTIMVAVAWGTLSDARWESTSARVNGQHGLQLTQADKRKRVLRALKHPNGAGKSDRAIAAHVGVSDKTVAKVRRELESTSEIPKSETRTGTDGRTINVGSIGKAAVPAVDARQFFDDVVNEYEASAGLEDSPEFTAAVATIDSTVGGDAKLRILSGDAGLSQEEVVELATQPAAEQAEELGITRNYTSPIPAKSQSLVRDVPAITAAKNSIAKKKSKKTSWQDAPHGYCPRSESGHEWSDDQPCQCGEPRPPQTTEERQLYAMNDPQVSRRDRATILFDVMAQPDMDREFYRALRSRFLDDVKQDLDRVVFDALPYAELLDAADAVNPECQSTLRIICDLLDSLNKK